MPKKLKNNPEKIEEIIEPPITEKKKRGRPRKAVQMVDGTTVFETPDILADDERGKDGKRLPTFEWFSIILYPYDDNHPDLDKPHKGDPLHYVALKWIQNYEPEYAYILHNKDVDESGKHKTNHVHVIFKHYARITLKTARKTFACWHMDKHLQTCSSPLAMAVYLPHRTPEAIAMGKYQYPISEVTRSTFFERIFAKLGKTEILFNSGKGMISSILKQYCCDTLDKAFTTLERLHIDYTEHISDYMLVQLVHDVKYILKNKTAYAPGTQFVTVNHRGEVLDIQGDFYKHDNFTELVTELQIEGDSIHE